MCVHYSKQSRASTKIDNKVTLIKNDGALLKQPPH